MISYYCYVIIITSLKSILRSGLFFSTWASEFWFTSQAFNFTYVPMESLFCFTFLVDYTIFRLWNFTTWFTLKWVIDYESSVMNHSLWVIYSPGSSSHIVVFAVFIEELLNDRHFDFLENIGGYKLSSSMIISWNVQYHQLLGHWLVE